MNWGQRLAYLVLLTVVAIVVYFILYMTIAANNTLLGADQGIANTLVGEGLPPSYVTDPALVNGINPSYFQGGISMLTSFLYLAVPIMIVTLAALLMYSARR